MDIFIERLYELLGRKHGAKKALADGLGINQNIITGWLGGRSRSYMDYAPQIAEYYNVSLDWLSGNSDIKNAPANNDERKTTDDDLMFALWGDSSDIDEDDLEDVRRFAAFVRERKKGKHD